MAVFPANTRSGASSSRRSDGDIRAACGEGSSVAPDQHRRFTSNTVNETRRSSHRCLGMPGRKGGPTTAGISHQTSNIVCASAYLQEWFH